MIPRKAAIREGGSRQLRIIGGQWRGKRIRFTPAEGLRPTPDAVRETLFNWLQGEIEGKRCLDLYAGSGILGFEALSRQADSVTSIEKNRKTASNIRLTGRELKTGKLTVRTEEVCRLLQRGGEAVDIVFVDPPFRLGLIARTCRLLLEKNWLSAGALIYTEFEAELAPSFPQAWNLIKEKRQGDVGYSLYQSE
ncbi:MAG: 16S rRNA (guanine(966)-N(2))-methyltransferase RsmD [Arenicellales bacterium]|jgi:16S rRNA (guanine966-N2)-methyltransferase|nr:16S rRNA (guanine(966)-N(2))-methyltransferase RsmD [Arenicellales bacterium]MDP6290134.1 16S rRNA (guanine(966)-N(2))-methyltransferase RsmD [Arenicellales bacterium]MDP7154881.1 16S rRNA (guanine(966)-N(2))-methyltransferase RsmD [Arenicellales bacterium]MDP7284337.1 16S rRNA (guanine(966)-N(2))-methyltransferase RsmD [Arenicellales bacterium]MDP7521988.1 16S rRNA (guanine(966)-N(2))-methyltransferase RsmD [Arenicellales bacterium]|tara:strand:- start:667 stop:1248 length:582 start_codon:yes stop_codon:yes gene_type:complete